MPVNTRQQIGRTVKNRKYLNKDFDELKSTLLEYAQTFFPAEKVGRDFSENGMGGLLLEEAAYVGDVLSFYLDHQFHELSPETAVESKNIERHLRDAGVKIVGASPAVVNVTFLIKVPAASNTTPADVETKALPIIQAGTILRADNGTLFELTEDVDFTETDSTTGNLLATKIIGDRDSSNNVTSFILSQTGVCVSGQRNTESFSTGTFSRFKKYTLAKEDVTEIISVYDSEGNVYYEVEHLTQDTVFKGIPNRSEDSDTVRYNMEVLPAPYRFLSSTSLATNLTTLVFGGGNAESLDNDIIPDPGELALPLYGRTTVSRFTLNPGNLLSTSTLGMIAPNATLTVVYRYGGGLNHNIAARTIRGINTLYMIFPNSPSQDQAVFVRSNMDAYNAEEASGGADSPTIDELKLRIGAERNAQARIVTKEDLLARIYTLPNEFGRVFRAAIRSNPNNPLSARLFVTCKNSSGYLTLASDTLKKNLATYLNEYRLISDAIDILDARIINFQVTYSVVIDPGYNKQLVLQNINMKLKDYFSIKNFELDQPIIVPDLQNVIFNNDGVVSVESIVVSNITGTVTGREYSDVQFDTRTNNRRGMIVGPPGSIFELKYPEYDINGIGL